MTPLRLICRSLRFYRRTHLGVAASAAVTGAVLVGALALGDCVRYSLRKLALARLGQVELAVDARERFFRAALADEVAADLQADAAGVLSLSAAVSAPRTALRANSARIIGVDERFWRLGGAAAAAPNLAEGEADAPGCSALAART